jgi:iron complex transport system ATP-binding protein
MLRCSRLSLEAAGRVLCRDVSLTCAPGEVWAVLGRNGTGKSTLIHALGGLARPAGGSIELDGVPIAACSARDRARAVGILLQMEEGTYWGSVLEYVLLGRYPHARGWGCYETEDIAEARAALDVVGMTHCASRRFATLSGGERQRVRIAQILAQRPRLLLLDEPLQHLDLAYQVLVLDLIGARVREDRVSAVMVLHEPLWIGRACTHALIFTGDGGAHAGPAHTVLTRERLEEAYACRLREVDHGDAGRSFVPDV